MNFLTEEISLYLPSIFIAKLVTKILKLYGRKIFFQLGKYFFPVRKINFASFTPYALRVFFYYSPIRES